MIDSGSDKTLKACTVCRHQNHGNAVCFNMASDNGCCCSGPNLSAGSDNLRDELTEDDRLDAIENMTYSIERLGDELAIVDALDQHSLQFEGSRNLGYYRTFIECSCGAGWWYGGHEGDPAAADRWAIHRAEVIRDARESEVARRVADAKAEALNDAAHDMPGDIHDPRHMADWLRARALASGQEGEKSND